MVSHDLLHGAWGHAWLIMTCHMVLRALGACMVDHDMQDDIHVTLLKEMGDQSFKKTSRCKRFFSCSNTPPPTHTHTHT